MNNVEMVVEKLILELPRIGAFLIYYIYLLNSCSPHLLSMIGLSTFAAIYVLHPFSKKLQRLQEMRGKIDTTTKNKLLETTTNIEFIKMNNKQKQEAKKIKQSYSQYLQNKLEDKQLSSVLSIASDVSTDLLTFIIFAVGAINVMYGFIEPVELLYLVIHTGNFYYQIINLKDVFISFNTILPKLKEVNDMISYDRIEDIDQSVKPSENFESCDNTVIFEDVVFSYDNGKNILDNINFVFKRNKINLLLGPNGSGKSTIMKLLFRLYELDQGIIRLYGADIKNLSLRELRNNITLVSKDPSIFEGTIWDNLIYGCESIDKDYVYEICGLLESNNWLDKNKLKDTGFRGNKLTGGEKKKIQIINAVCRSGNILVFDEPSNALDSNAIKWFIDFVNKLRNSYGKTIIIASHDLRLVDASDHLVEL
jgi:ABC-type bacteriocin/lantibiotic exporter with double-glycine peptidase domain